MHPRRKALSNADLSVNKWVEILIMAWKRSRNSGHPNPYEMIRFAVKWSWLKAMQIIAWVQNIFASRRTLRRINRHKKDMANSVFIFRNKANNHYQLTTEQASQYSKFGSVCKFDDCHSVVVNQSQSKDTSCFISNFWATCLDMYTDHHQTSYKTVCKS